MSFKSDDKLSTCETCIMGKQTAKPFPKVSDSKSEDLLDLVHSDVCGPMRTKSLGGASYFITFIDDKSNWVEVQFLKTKGEAKGAFIKFQAYSENRTERKIKTLRTDNGLEYCGQNFTKDLERNGVR